MGLKTQRTYLVIGSGEDLGDDELPGPSDRAASVAEVGVLEQDAGVLFVDANGVLDRFGTSISSDEVGVHVVNGSLAVAPQSEAVGHIASSVFSDVECVFSLVRVLRVASRRLVSCTWSAFFDGKLTRKEQPFRQVICDRKYRDQYLCR